MAEKKRFEIGMWGLDNEAADDETFRLIASVGITHVFMNGKKSFTDVQKKVLTLCEKHGLKVYIFSHGMTEDLQTRADDPAILLGYPAFDGIIAFDEPTLYQLDSICDLIEDFQKKYGEKTAFVNLYPSYVDLNINNKYVGADTYEEYIDRCCERLFAVTKGRRILSIDFYPLCVRPETGENYIFPDWLSDLEVGRKYANKYSSELHFCLQTTEFGKEHRAPEEADFRFQFYTCFAMGVTGFSYFTYESPLPNIEFEYHQVGMIDRERKPTVRHGYAKILKKEISAFEDEMLSSRHVGARVFVGSENTGLTEAFDKLKYTVEKFKRIEKVSCTQNTVVGEYEKDGAYSYVAVNYTDPSNGVFDEVKLIFDRPCRATVYRKGIPVEFFGAVLEMILEPGEGAYISVKKEDMRQNGQVVVVSGRI